MKITFDSAKRAKTLAERQIDSANAATVFEGPIFTLLDDRIDYGEQRFQTYGCWRIVWCLLSGRREARIGTSYR